MGAFLIDPGAMGVELALEQATMVPDGQGGHALAWSEVARVFARVEPTGARSFAEGEQTAAAVSHRITVRWRADVRSGMRFTRGARVFAILAVHDPDERERFLVCQAREEGR